MYDQPWVQELLAGDKENCSSYLEETEKDQEFGNTKISFATSDLKDPFSNFFCGRLNSQS